MIFNSYLLFRSISTVIFLTHLTSKASDGKIRWHACGKPGEIHFNNSETKQKQFANKTSL